MPRCARGWKRRLHHCGAEPVLDAGVLDPNGDNYNPDHQPGRHRGKLDLRPRRAVPGRGDSMGVAGTSDTGRGRWRLHRVDRLRPLVRAGHAHAARELQRRAGRRASISISRAAIRDVFDLGAQAEAVSSGVLRDIPNTPLTRFNDFPDIPAANGASLEFRHPFGQRSRERFRCAAHRRLCSRREHADALRRPQRLGSPTFARGQRRSRRGTDAEGFGSLRRLLPMDLRPLGPRCSGKPAVVSNSSGAPASRISSSTPPCWVRIGTSPSSFRPGYGDPANAQARYPGGGDAARLRHDRLRHGIRWRALPPPCSRKVASSTR